MRAMEQQRRRSRLKKKQTGNSFLFGRRRLARSGPFGENSEMKK